MTGRLVVDDDPARVALERAWATEIDAAAHQLAAAWPGRTVPAPERWPGYSATRVRTLRRLAGIWDAGHIARAKAAPQGVPGGGGPPPLPWVEVRLEDKDSGLFGSPDLVEEVGGRLRVVDLKSGVHQGDVRPSQRLQLLLYAHLVQVASGRAVDELAVVDVRGSERTIVPEQAEIVAAVQTATDAREAFSLSVTAGDLVADTTSCGYCPFRVVCAAHWEVADGSECAVTGVVQEVCDGVALVGTAEGSIRLVLASGVNPAVGDRLAAVDLEPAGPATLRMRWDSGFEAEAAGLG